MSFSFTFFLVLLYEFLKLSLQTEKIVLWELISIIFLYIQNVQNQICAYII